MKRVLICFWNQEADVGAVLQVMAVRIVKHAFEIVHLLTDANPIQQLVTPPPSTPNTQHPTPNTQHPTPNTTPSTPHPQHHNHLLTVTLSCPRTRSRIC